MTGRKDDHGKLRWSLLPIDSVEEVVKVLEHGAQKYGMDNWSLVDDGAKRYLDAALRHMVEYMKGVERDEESGHHHLAHAAASLLFIMAIEK